MEKIKRALIKMLVGIAKALIKWVEKLGGEVEQLIENVGEAVVKEIEELEVMTIPELRVYAKEMGINLKGERVKAKIIEVILENLK